MPASHAAVSATVHHAFLCRTRALHQLYRTTTFRPSPLQCRVCTMCAGEPSVRPSLIANHSTAFLLPKSILDSRTCAATTIRSPPSPIHHDPSAPLQELRTMSVITIFSAAHPMRPKLRINGHNSPDIIPCTSPPMLSQRISSSFLSTTFSMSLTCGTHSAPLYPPSFLPCV